MAKRAREDINMKIAGLKVLDLTEHLDVRGSFQEIFSDRFLAQAGLSFFTTSQINLSISRKNVFRGIHFSKAAQPQHKLVACLNGYLTDFVLDLRVGSPTYLELERIPLSASDRRLIFIPSGCGHGFLAHSESTTLLYAQSSEYSPSEEFELNVKEYFDNLGGVQFKDLVLSDKDREAPTIAELREKGMLPQFEEKSQI